MTDMIRPQDQEFRHASAVDRPGQPEPFVFVFNDGANWDRLRAGVERILVWDAERSVWVPAKVTLLTEGG